MEGRGKRSGDIEYQADRDLFEYRKHYSQSEPFVGSPAK